MQLQAGIIIIMSTISIRITTIIISSSSSSIIIIIIIIINNIVDTIKLQAGPGNPGAVAGDNRTPRCSCSCS